MVEGRFEVKLPTIYDKMDRCKAEKRREGEEKKGARSKKQEARSKKQEARSKKKKKEERKSLRKKVVQVCEKVGKSRNTVLFQ